MNTADTRNPGDPDARKIVERTIRVDQAGEFGAVRIYEGQLAALRWRGQGRSQAHAKIAAMARAEREHRAEFDRLLVERRVRPTLLSPLWSVAGFALGAATALMGEKAAMACTVAAPTSSSTATRPSPPAPRRPRVTAPSPPRSKPAPASRSGSPPASDPTSPHPSLPIQMGRWRRHTATEGS